MVGHAFPAPISPRAASSLPWGTSRPPCKWPGARAGKDGGRGQGVNSPLWPGRRIKFMKANDRGSPEVLRGQPAPTRCLPAQLGTSWPGPSNRGPQAGLCAPQPQCWLGHQKRPGKTPGMEPPARPWHGSVQEWPKGKEMPRSLRAGPPSPSPPPGWCSPHPRALWVSCDRNSCLNEHALCPIIMRLLQRQWPVEARPAWGLLPWEAPCTWAWRWVKGGGLVVLATPEACPRVLGPALQDPLSASSLTGSPPGSVWARLTAGGRGSGGGGLSYVTKAQKRWAVGPDEAGHQVLCGYGAKERSPPTLGSLPHAPPLPPALLLLRKLVCNAETRPSL